MAGIVDFPVDPILVARRLQNLRLIAAEARRIQAEEKLPNDSLCGHVDNKALRQAMYCEMRLEAEANQGSLKICSNSLTPATIEILRRRGYVVDELPPLEDMTTEYWVTVEVPEESISIPLRPTEPQPTSENAIWKVHDKVRIRATPPTTDDMRPIWVSDMNTCCGREGFIVSIVNNNLKIHINDYLRRYNFRSEWVEKV